MGRTLAALCIVASISALGAVSVGIVHRAVQNANPGWEENSLRFRYGDSDVFTPIEQRIANKEALIAMLRRPQAIAEEKEKLAALYDSQGKRCQALGNLARAELSFRSAIAFSPRNAAFCHDLGVLYDIASQQQVDPNAKLQLARNAVDAWVSAYKLEGSDPARMIDSEGAANAELNLAMLYRSLGDSSESRTCLLRAKTLATANTALAQSIDAALSRP